MTHRTPQEALACLAPHRRRMRSPALEAAGYVLHIREPDWFEHRLFKGPDTAINLHVFSAGCPEIARMLLFRDWLRAHPDDRQLYERTKRELAQRIWKYTQNYADAKTTVVKEILARAQRASAAPDHAGEAAHGDA